MQPQGFTLGYFLPPLRGWNGAQAFSQGFTPGYFLPSDQIGVLAPTGSKFKKKSPRAKGGTWGTRPRDYVSIRSTH